MSNEDVRQSSERFYSVLNGALNGDAGAFELLPEVCSQRDDMTVMSEMGGRQIGWSEVRTMWEMAVQAVDSGSAEMSDVRITSLGNDAAYTTGTLTVSASISGMPLNFSARCTDIFHREDVGWKLVHHHLDCLPNASELQSALAQAG